MGHGCSSKSLTPGPIPPSPDPRKWFSTPTSSAKASPKAYLLALPPAYYPPTCLPSGLRSELLGLIEGAQQAFVPLRKRTAELRGRHDVQLVVQDRVQDTLAHLARPHRRPARLAAPALRRGVGIGQAAHRAGGAPQPRPDAARGPHANTASRPGPFPAPPPPDP